MQTLDARCFKSGELAKLAGVSADTLHHYDKMGVLPAPVRLDNGYREYPAAALDRVLLIRRALGLGFTLGELAPLLAARDTGKTPCKEVRSLAVKKLREVEQRLKALTLLRDQLRELVASWGTRLADTPEGTQARLLDNLPALVPAPLKRGKLAQIPASQKETR